MNASKKIILAIFLVVSLASCSSNQPQIGPVERYQSGNKHLKAQRYKQAISDYQAAISMDDEQAPYHYNLGLAYYRINLFELAKKAFEEAIAQDPKMGDAWFNLSLVLYKLGDTEAAFLAHEKYIKINKTPSAGQPKTNSSGS